MDLAKTRNHVLSRHGPIFQYRQTVSSRYNNFVKKVNIKVVDRENWHRKVGGLLGKCLIWYKDGSVADEGVGSGVFEPKTNLFNTALDN